MMGLEPTTFCMAKCERPFAPVRASSLKRAVCRRFRTIERTRVNPSERRTLPFLPRNQAPDSAPGSQAHTAAHFSLGHRLVGRHEQGELAGMIGLAGRTPRA